MALEAVVYSQGFFGCCTMAAEGEVEGMMDLDGSNWDVDACSTMFLQGFEPPEPGGGTENTCSGGQETGRLMPAERRKRRRTRSMKNKEEVENQRMAHIAIERNRRKQMNDYLSVLRSLMPYSYVQRGDQASIIGGAINFVKELERLLQSLEAQKRTRHCPSAGNAAAAPFAGFFTFLQYSTSATRAPNTAMASMNNDGKEGGSAGTEVPRSKPSAVADIQVTMVESHANLKMLSRRRPKQLLRMVVGLQERRLAVLHLNMIRAGQMVLYSFSLKVEDDCQLSSVDDIATAVHHIIETIEEEHGRGLD